MVPNVGWSVSFFSVLGSSIASNLESLSDHIWFMFFQFLLWLILEGVDFLGFSLGYVALSFFH